MVLVDTVSKLLGKHSFKLGGNVKSIEQAQSVLNEIYPFEIKVITIEELKSV